MEGPQMAESGVMSAIQDFTAQTGGIVGVAAKHLETGEGVCHNADTVFFTASTLKGAVIGRVVSTG